MDIKLSTIETRSGLKPNAIWIDGKHFVPAKGPMVTDEMWQALAEQEKYLYRGEVGCHSYTGVMVFDELDDFLGQIWFQAAISVENSGDHDWEKLSQRTQMAMIARRVAQTLAVINFGPEFLLK